MFEWCTDFLPLKGKYPRCKYAQTPLSPLRLTTEQSCCLRWYLISLALEWDETPRMNNLPFRFSFTLRDPFSALVSAGPESHLEWSVFIGFYHTNRVKGKREWAATHGRSNNSLLMIFPSLVYCVLCHLMQMQTTKHGYKVKRLKALICSTYAQFGCSALVSTKWWDPSLDWEEEQCL